MLENGRNGTTAGTFSKRKKWRPTKRSMGGVLQGNFIGTDVSGIQALGNRGDGVLIFGTASSNTNIGGTDHDVGVYNRACNLISGNAGAGVDLSSLVGPTSTNVLLGNFIGTNVSDSAALGNGSIGVVIGSPGNTIGGTVPGARNVISGNAQFGIDLVGPQAFGNVIQGNFIGTDISGTVALGNGGSDGVLLNGGSHDNVIGGTTPGAGNVISGNASDGIHLTGSGTTGNLIQGNLIGTDITGMAALGNGNRGVAIDDHASNNTVGGAVAGAGNLISGNAAPGVVLQGGATGNRVQGNSIGTNSNSQDGLMGNRAGGVYISGASGNLVGGTEDGAGNLIAYNVRNGVTVVDGVGNSIRRNSIHNHPGLGIDIGDDGVTNINLPTIESAWSDATGTTVQGSITSTPVTRFVLEFFANSSPNPSGYGEGEVYIGTTMVETSNMGVGLFQVHFTPVTPPGYSISATATDPVGTTWEFSLSVVVGSGSGSSGGAGSGAGGSGRPVILGLPTDPWAAGDHISYSLGSTLAPAERLQDPLWESPMVQSFSLPEDLVSLTADTRSSAVETLLGASERLERLLKPRGQLSPAVVDLLAVNLLAE
jgi:titin